MEQALFLIQNITLGTIIHYRGTGYDTKNMYFKGQYKMGWYHISY